MKNSTKQILTSALAIATGMFLGHETFKLAGPNAHPAPIASPAPIAPPAAHIKIHLHVAAEPGHPYLDFGDAAVLVKAACKANHNAGDVTFVYAQGNNGPYERTASCGIWATQMIVPLPAEKEK